MSRPDKLKARRRRDVLKLLSGSSDIIVADYDERNFGKLQVLFQGPMETPYEGGSFQLSITLPRDYPLSPPTMHCETPIWHPNISLRGSICVDYLEDKWMAAITLLEAIEGIQGLLRNPNANSPLNCTAAVMMRRDDAMYSKTALMWTKTFAGGMVSDAEFEEKVSLVTALGATKEEAVKQLASDMWEVDSAIDNLHL